MKLNVHKPSNWAKIKTVTFDVSIKKKKIDKEPLLTLTWIPKLYSTNSFGSYRQDKLTKEYYMKIKNIERISISKVNNFPLYLQKIYDRNFNCN